MWPSKWGSLRGGGKGGEIDSIDGNRESERADVL